jgi:predicted ATPase
MLNTLAVSGYRSLRDLVVPLGHLNLVTGPNGSGKSNIYRALRLLAAPPYFANPNSVMSTFSR